MHVHVLPPRHARGLHQTLWKSKRERIVRHDALHRHQGARATTTVHHPRRPITPASQPGVDMDRHERGVLFFDMYRRFR